ncbi:MAG TPA: DUF1697 domain-containing protein [Vicinamibacterales bacterium]|nr:DUF1697 domain-containing protein [Vicinamibacterales bacterium]
MTYVALLRGVNVGGNKMLAMADLRDALTKIGFSSVTTVLQSGNVVFDAAVTTPATMEALLEKEIDKRLGLKADFHVRTAADWHAIVKGNPFAVEAKKDPSHLLVSFFKAPLDQTRVKALRSAITGPERLIADGRHLYMTFPAGMGNSKAARLVDKLLTARGTARNWNTVMKLALLIGRGTRA